MLLLGLLACLPRGGVCGEPTDASPFRIGLALESFGNVDRNDASVAVKVWAATVMKETGLNVAPTVEIFRHPADVVAELRRRKLDAASLSAEEFLRLDVIPAEFYVGARGSEIAEEYVLLARVGGAADVRALKGRKLIWNSSPKTSLALPWLETHLARHGLGGAREFFGEVQNVESTAKAVLRVFFGQADACLVTAGALSVAGEMNPQVRRELAVLAVSPAVIPMVLFFRPDFSGSAREQMGRAFENLHRTPAGRQILTIFQGDRIVRRPRSCLDSTEALLEEYRRLPPAPPARPAAVLPSSPARVSLQRRAGNRGRGRREGRAAHARRRGAGLHAGRRPPEGAVGRFPR
jgi:hypothetical protein